MTLTTLADGLLGLGGVLSLVLSFLWVWRMKKVLRSEKQFVALLDRLDRTMDIASTQLFALEEKSETIEKKLDRKIQKATGLYKDLDYFIESGEKLMDRLDPMITHLHKIVHQPPQKPRSVHSVAPLRTDEGLAEKSLQEETLNKPSALQQLRAALLQKTGSDG